jgi:MATE family multidrug resistance protein
MGSCRLRVLTKWVGAVRGRYGEDAGYREVISLAIPLVLSSGAWAIQHFVDRMFLTWYSPEAVAAATPAGILNYALMSVFIGTAGYVSTFVAQYYGAQRYDRIGPSVWQGVYVAVVGGVAMLLFVPAARPLFAFAGHDPLVQQYEVEYFRILCLGAFPPIASSALSGFFLGIGRTVPVMVVNLVETAANLLLDYLLIFGKAGFPEMGIRGAAWATVAAGTLALLIYFVLIARAENARECCSLSGWRFEPELFRRLIQFGFPSGMQFFLDVAGFTAFVMLVGRLGTIELAATNIAFNINTIAFQPMIGFGIAVSVLVGQRLGENRPELAERSVWSAFHLTFAYMASVAALYVLVPDLFLAPFAAGSDAGRFEMIRQTTKVLLRFVALYSLFDTMNIVFASAIKGAGDTRFVLRMIVLASCLLFVLPTYVLIVRFGKGIYAAWTVASIYVIALGMSFLLRFLLGAWKQMRVIEGATASVPPALPETPTLELEM